MLLSQDAYQKIDREVNKFPVEQKQSAVIAALAIAQDEQGWVSPAVIRDVADYLKMPAIAVQEVATFYNLFQTKPAGQFKLLLCTNLPCALSGAERAAAHLKNKLGVAFGETTADGRITLLEGECLGACGDAPVLLVNNKRLCGLMSETKLDGLIDELNTVTPG